MFLLAFDNTNNGNEKVERNSHTKYFHPRVNITDYNVLIDGRNFYDQSINDQIKKFDEIRKIRTRQGDDYTAACFFKDHYLVVAVDLDWMLIQEQLNRLSFMGC